MTFLGKKVAYVIDLNFLKDDMAVEFKANWCGNVAQVMGTDVFRSSRGNILLNRFYRNHK